jgi:hypothetical protein
LTVTCLPSKLISPFSWLAASRSRHADELRRCLVAFGVVQEQAVAFQFGHIAASDQIDEQAAVGHGRTWRPCARPASVSSNPDATPPGTAACG